jgi:hypothetical protein
MCIAKFSILGRLSAHYGTAKSCCIATKIVARQMIGHAPAKIVRFATAVASGTGVARDDA